MVDGPCTAHMRLHAHYHCRCQFGLALPSEQFEAITLALALVSSNTQTYCRWTKLGNVLILESPAGVGYSYCDDGSACGSTDESTADDTLELMANFFERYPEYAKHAVFLTGESYAGAAPDIW